MKTEFLINLGDSGGEIDRCMSCGLCLQDCPTYNITGRFSSSPRGRIRLMKHILAGTIALDDIVPYTGVSVQHELETCLGCLACKTSCPADIMYPDLLDGLKVTLYRERKKYSEQLDTFLEEMPVGQPEKFRRLMGMLSVAGRSGLIGLVNHTPLKNLLPSVKRNMARLLAKKIPFRSSSKVLSGVLPAVGRKKMRVGMFLGCINDHMFPEANYAIVRVLRRLGAEVVIPQTESCCGAIHHHMGETGLSGQMAITNCERFAGLDVDAIAVNAAGCGFFIKNYGKAVPGNPVIEEIGPRFRDIHEIIWELLDMDPSLKDQWIWPRKGEKFTYHEACHLVHGQGIGDLPLTLLKYIRGLEFVPLNESSMCCGSAGTHNIFYPELSQKIQERKIRNILDTGSGIVAAANSGCVLQILSGLRQKGKFRIKCYHPVEMIDMSWLQEKS